ncbi:hypothetical protein, partial [Paenibacillus sp. S-12]|uniref:hypothetical protein n=1 Tax=Paenibacillus sp. S-12 TaxID=3031371 RepID=UPI0025A1CE14
LFYNGKTEEQVGMPHRPLPRKPRRGFSQRASRRACAFNIGCIAIRLSPPLLRKNPLFISSISQIEQSQSSFFYPMLF